MTEADKISTLAIPTQLQAASFLRLSRAEIAKGQLVTAAGDRVKDLVLTEARRDLEYQAGLFSIGRLYQRSLKKWIVVNEGSLVTRTMDSKHVKGEAFDIALIVSGKLSWPDPKFIVNKALWLLFVDIGKQCGLKPGAEFTHPDYPHFESP